MGLFVRKFERAKWSQNDVQNGQPPSADAITGCMRTKHNTLSLWLIESTDEIDEAVVALVSGFERLNAFDVLYFPCEDIEAHGLSLSATEGLTPYKLFKDRHRDVDNLDYCGLGEFSKIVVNSLCESRAKRYKKSELKEMLIESVDSGKIDLNDLNSRLREDLGF